MSVASRVDEGNDLVAGGGTRAAGKRRGSTSLPFADGRPKAGSILSELFPSSPRDAGWTGFVLSHLEPGRPLLWVQERMAIREGGRVHPAGLGEFGRDLIHVEVRDARAALWTMEEGLRCAGLSGVIGEIWGDPRALDFTATRRLAVAAEKRGRACWLVRLQGQANLSGARERWRLASAPSEPHPLDPKAPGTPRWEAELFRSRLRAVGAWRFTSPRAGEGPGEAHPFPVVPQSPDRALGEPVRQRA